LGGGGGDGDGGGGGRRFFGEDFEFIFLFCKVWLFGWSK
jgi:hypothetical protein